MIFSHLPRRTTAFLLALGVGLFSALPALAALSTGIEEGGAFQQALGLGTGDVRIIVANLIRIFLGLLGVIAISLIVYGGFLWMTSAGNEERVQKAKAVIINAIVGLVIIMMSYIIVSFVLGKLLGVLGYTPTTPGGDDDSIPPLFPTESVFTIESVSPQGTQTIKNLTGRLTFNRNVDSDTLKDNITITAEDAPSATEVEFTVSGDRVRFRPTALCEGYTDEYCFEENTRYTVHLGSALASEDGLAISCGGIYDTCDYTFVSGDLIDTEDPSVSIMTPVDGASISVNALVSLQARVEDDGGVSEVEFYADETFIDSDQPDGDTPLTFDGEVVWDTSALVELERYAVSAVAHDVNDHSSYDKITVIARAEHCFSGSKDEDEEGEDCGGVDCGACGGSSCTDASECASAVCGLDGVCVDAPEITAVSPGSGAVGTYVTIKGNNFGSLAGTIYFGDTKAVLADCQDAWSHDQVIAVVPPTLEMGTSQTITLKTFGGYTDTTQDDFGALVADFEVTSIEHPGICSLTPSVGEVGSFVVARGVNFGEAQDGSSVYLDSTEVNGYSSWKDNAVTVVVPTLVSNAYAFTLWVNGVSSNEVTFSVEDSDAEENPVISAIDPETGPAGEYITITGSGFGSSPDLVYFTNNDPTSSNYGVGRAGDVTFPAVCEDDYWSTDQIIVKVPTSVDTGASVITVRKATQTSNGVDFTVKSGTAGPGICAIDPEAGPVDYGTIALYGERFNDQGMIGFYDGSQSKVPAEIVSWNDEEVVVTAVPKLAVTGPVLLTDSMGYEGNKVLFEVGDCNEKNLCDANTQQCCSSGACYATGATCPENDSVSAEYVWKFSTGDIPTVPTLDTACSGGVISPTPWDGRAGGDAVCVNAGIAGSFDVNMNTKTFTTSNITLDACTAGGSTPCTSLSAVALDSEVTTTNNSFMVFPAESLEASRTYQVSLSSNITSSLGVAISATVWTFETSSDSDDCAFEAVNVTPSEDTIEELNGHTTFNARELAQDECVILNDEDVDWTWTVNPNEGQFISFDNSYDATCKGAPSSCQAVKGIAEGTSVLTAEESTQGLDDDADVIVNFTNPRAIDLWPDCDDGGTACINASIGAQFNTAMDETTVEQAGAFLYACSDESCDTYTDQLTIDVTRADNDKTIININVDDTNYPLGYLTAQTYYQVVISGDVESESGVPLNEYYNGDLSWTFLTRDSKEPCAVDHVVVEPNTKTLTYVGATAVFQSVPYSEADSCSNSGQRLTATDYDWTWAVANSTIAEFWPLPPNTGTGAVQVASEQIPEGCTTSCLPEGTDAYEAICGQDADGDGNLLDDGEECDDGEALNGDGCSSTCLNEGTSAPVCGNNTIDDGEECDDGEALNGDGCSSTCLNEGAEGGVTTCGDGVVTQAELLNSHGWAGGEDCDYASSRDSESAGCSNRCLYEGSTSVDALYGICGDGQLDEPAEQCDDGDTANGDGCSDRCLYEGSVACDSASESDCCGNGVPESSAFESCDDGNATSGDGCSSSCLLEGSSATYAEPSWCGDGVVAISEYSLCEIDSGELDGVVEPEQIAVIAKTAPGEVVDGIASTNLSATTVATTGEARLSLLCSCTTDGECGGGTALGCGLESCCYERPSITDYTPAPTSNGACRNALISLDFSQTMALATFTDEVTVELLGVDGEAEENCPYTAESASTEGAMNRSGSLLSRAWTSLRHFWGGLVGVAVAGSTEPCLLPITFTGIETDDVETVSLIYTQLLEEDRTYRVTVTGDASQNGSGVRSANGVGLGDDYTYDVEVGDDVCSFDAVSVEDVDASSSGVFTVIGETHDFTATAQTLIGGVAQAIVPIENVYAWDWSQTWWSTDETILSVPKTGTDTATQSTNVVTAVGENGTESIYASATITADILFEPSTKEDEVYGSASITAVLCENPWPAKKASQSWDAFRDESIADGDPDGDGVSEVAKGEAWMNFTTYYCRDAGEAGTTEDYPTADVVAVAEPPEDVLKEYLFQLDGADAIGIRIASNEDLLTITDWYEAQEFTGTPTATTVDGYQALEDGRTTYVSAANLNGSTTGMIYPNIYVISYNENASSETIAIFDQMLANWSFNSNITTNDELCYESSGEPSVDANGDIVACTSDLGCDSDDYCRADKSKLQRDMQRLTDLKGIAEVLEIYGSEHGRCSATTTTSCTSDDDCSGVETCLPLYPTVDSGSFLRALSSSAWSSWQDVFGAELDATLPTDPLNAYASCGDTPGDYSDYTADACWYEAKAQYVCPNGSHVYNYRNLGGTDYELFADLEYTYVSGLTEWFGSVDADVSDDLQIVAGRAFLGKDAGFQTLPTCNGTVLGNSATCGDGVIGSAEKCEVGDTSQVLCHALTCVSVDPDYDGASCLIDCTNDDICSGGDANNDGVCDSGAAKDQACNTGSVDCTDKAVCTRIKRTGGVQTSICNTDSCLAYKVASDAECVPFRCGNGVIDGGETCDDGSYNGQYGYCGTNCAYDASAFYCGDGTLAGGETCDNGASNGKYAASEADSCNGTCDGPAGYCGDAKVTNSEVCDGSESWSGELCAGGTNEGEPCTEDSECAGGQCGAGYSCELTTTVSCDGLDDTTSCGSWGDCQEQSSTEETYYACGLPDTSSTTCSGPTDTSCPEGGVCGEYKAGSYACYDPFEMSSCTSEYAYMTDPSVCPPNPDGAPITCDVFARVLTDYTCELSKEISCSGLSDTTTCSSPLICSGGGSDYGACGTGTVCEDYSDAGTSCTDDTICDSGNCDDVTGLCTSAADVGDYCDTSGKKSNGTACDSTTCSTYEYDLTRSRSCNDTCSVVDPWSDCARSDESCGNGVVDGTEVCDDGNDSNNDDCTNLCTANVCGDGYLYTDQEDCDRGEENGQACEADYGSTCRYCDYDCTYLTRSSAYCGDGVLDQPQEFCEAGSLSQYYCYNAYTDEIGDLCYNKGSSDECDEYSTCRNVGVCNGGLDADDHCTNNLSLKNFKTDQTYCRGGTCALPTCSADCGSACPYSYANQSVEVTSEEAGATARDSISLFSADSADSPNLATLTIPACTIANGLTANIALGSDRSYPAVYVMFVIDASLSMSPTEMGFIQDAATTAAASLFDSYTGADAEMHVGFALIGGPHGSDSDSDSSQYVSEELYNFVNNYGRNLTTDDSSLISSMTTKLGASFTTAGMPIYKSLQDAADAMPSPDDGERYIILFSGDINNNSTELSALYSLQTAYDTDLDGALEDNEYLALTDDTADTAKNDDITIFTVALSNDDDTLGYLAHLSSDACNSTEPITDSFCSGGYTDDEGELETCDKTSDCYVGTCPADSGVTYCHNNEDCNPELPSLCVNKSITDASGGTCTNNDDCYGKCAGIEVYTNCADYESGVNDDCNVVTLGTSGTCDGETVVMDDPMTTGTDESKNSTEGDCSNTGDKCTFDIDCVTLGTTTRGTCSTADMCVPQDLDYTCTPFAYVNTCLIEDDPYASADDCVQEYSSSTDSPSDLSGLLENVVESIGGVIVTITDASGHTASDLVSVGDNISLPLPDLFACDDSASQDVQFEVNFPGVGSVNFENILLNMCAP